MLITRVPGHDDYPAPRPRLSAGGSGIACAGAVAALRRAVANGDHTETLRLYVIDSDMSSECYGLFRTSEILLRETIHRALAASFGPACFRERRLRAILDSRTVDSLDEAMRDVRTVRAPAPPDAVVARLMLGTWIRFLAPGPGGRHEARLWNPVLSAVFQEGVDPAAPRRRADVYALTQHLLWARNRVNHCEPVVFGFPLLGQVTPTGQYRRLTPHQLVDDVRGLIGSMNPDVGRWADSWRTLDVLLADPLVAEALRFMDRQPQIRMEGRR